MWICRICEHKSGRRGNIIRHMKLVHFIDDRDCKNAYKDSNKALRTPHMVKVGRILLFVQMVYSRICRVLEYRCQKRDIQT